MGNVARLSMRKEMGDLVNVPISTYSGNKGTWREMGGVYNTAFAVAQHFNPFLTTFVLL